MLAALSALLPFELAAGLNGSVWVNAPSGTRATALVARALQTLAGETDAVTVGSKLDALAHTFGLEAFKKRRH